jgi:hypothetical protein
MSRRLSRVVTTTSPSKFDFDIPYDPPQPDWLDPDDPMFKDFREVMARRDAELIGSLNTKIDEINLLSKLPWDLQGEEMNDDTVLDIDEQLAAAKARIAELWQKRKEYNEQVIKEISDIAIGSVALLSIKAQQWVEQKFGITISVKE